MVLELVVLEVSEVQGEPEVLEALEVLEELEALVAPGALERAVLSHRGVEGKDNI